MLSREAESCGAADLLAGEVLAFDGFVTLETGWEAILETGLDTIMGDPLR